MEMPGEGRDGETREECNTLKRKKEIMTVKERGVALKVDTAHGRNMKIVKRQESHQIKSR